MCVIITSPDRSRRPTLEQLTLCEATNSHGSGLAWLSGRHVQYEKGLSVVEIHDFLRRLNGPAIVHFRIASVGGAIRELAGYEPDRWLGHTLYEVHAVDGGTERGRQMLRANARRALAAVADHEPMLREDAA